MVTSTKKSAPWMVIPTYFKSEKKTVLDTISLSQILILLFKIAIYFFHHLSNEHKMIFSKT